MQTRIMLNEPYAAIFAFLLKLLSYPFAVKLQNCLVDYDFPLAFCDFVASHVI